MGLPLALQIIGKPFDEQTMLRVGHAYEKATPWRAQRPALAGDMLEARTAELPAGAGAVDSKTATRVTSLVERSGLRLPEPLFALLCEIAPLVFAMADRIPRHGNWYAEPAAAFRFAD